MDVYNKHLDAMPPKIVIREFRQMVEMEEGREKGKKHSWSGCCKWVPHWAFDVF